MVPLLPGGFGAAEANPLSSCAAPIRVTAAATTSSLLLRAACTGIPPADRYRRADEHHPRCGALAASMTKNARWSCALHPRSTCRFLLKRHAGSDRWDRWAAPSRPATEDRDEASRGCGAWRRVAGAGVERAVV